jgi:hypothetical protein
MMRWLFHNLHALSVIGWTVNTATGANVLCFGFCRLYPFTPQLPRQCWGPTCISLLHATFPWIWFINTHIPLSPSLTICSILYRRLIALDPNVLYIKYHFGHFFVKFLNNKYCSFMSSTYFVGIFWRLQMVKIRRHPVASTWEWRSSGTGLINCCVKNRFLLIFGSLWHSLT